MASSICSCAQYNVHTRTPRLSLGAVKRETVRVEPSEEEQIGSEPWMVDELTRYYQGRRRLADMMGTPPHEFTDKDVEEALRYLLPSRLFARDARPSMKV